MPSGRWSTVTFNAHILETGTQSYRLRTSKTTARRKRAGWLTGGYLARQLLDLLALFDELHGATWVW